MGRSNLRVISHAGTDDRPETATVLYKPFSYSGDVILQPLQKKNYDVNLFTKTFHPLPSGSASFKNTSKHLYVRMPATMEQHEFTKLYCYVSNFSNYNSTCGAMQLLTPLGERSVAEATRVTADNSSLLEFEF